MKREDKIKIYNKIFKICFYSLLITYITLYFSQVTGYYEYDQHKKVTLTQDQIKKFEEDVQNGVDLNIEDYVKIEQKDYQNKASEIGLTISTTLGDYLKKGIENTFNFIGGLIEDQ